MLVSDLIRPWAIRNGLGVDHPYTITELVSLEGGPGRGGGTRRAAQALGLPLGTKTEIASSERFIQRRMQYEAGAGTSKQARPGKRTRSGKEITQADIKRLIDARTPDGQIRKYGLMVTRVKARMGKSAKWEEGRVVPVDGREPVEIPGEALDKFLEAIGRGDWDEAARELNETWDEAYDAPLYWGDEWGIREGVRVHMPVVESLHMQIGAGGPVRRRLRAS